MKKHFFKFGLSAAVLLILITGCGDAADKTTDATTAEMGLQLNNHHLQMPMIAG